ncbi:hypothetical protein FF124_13280 [Martelella lutilitoris]|uniref:Uncharacterized protein n=1 Tax=Martelella lutilitoris TaxID=2583532 RepID=A0A5C4JP80_9HYPH|nr:hypothetical protein [Martelella lutilitoris]TNB47148.1 hypothetical protein FF124_13280 [Martelella lutilitoris]
MLENLIEHWLDSIGERGYQAAFLQMLIGEGHTIMHSTRHNAMELGKDIITIGPDGIPCGFQLKGNPGGRLTLNQYREISSQLKELVEYPLKYPGIPEGPHRCFLVTNGEVEEEVQRSISDFNESLKSRGFDSKQKIEIISRGQILSWAIKYSHNFWPNDFSIHENIIKMYNVDGKSLPELDNISSALDIILSITVKDEGRNKISFERSLISSALYISFCIRNYVRRKNHTAIAACWVTLMAFYAGALERYAFSPSKNLQRSFDVAREAFFSAILDLFDEVERRSEAVRSNAGSSDFDINRIYLQSGGLSDRYLWNARALKTLSLLSLLDIEDKRADSKFRLSSQQRDSLKNFLSPEHTKIEIWGEAAIPQVLTYCFGMWIKDASQRPDLLIFDIINWIVSENKNRNYSFPPYYNIDDCLRMKLKSALNLNGKDLSTEIQSKSSFFAEGLLHCFVRSNLKSLAKAIWPEITRISHNAFYPESSWAFCLWRVPRGKNTSRQMPFPYNWSDIQQEASNIETPHVPSLLRADPLILLAFIIFHPHRSIPEVLRYLHFAICGTWFLPSAIPEDENKLKYSYR